MVAFLYRMGQGFAGDANRGWAGLTIEPNYADPNNPISAYGMPVKLNPTGTGVMQLQATDLAGAVYGLLVRPFPMQQPTAAGNYGQQQLTDPTTPPTRGELDVLRRGYASVLVNSGSSSGIIKGQQVHIWIAATTAGHTQNQFEGSPTPGSTIPAPATFNGPVDSNGITEIGWNI